MNTINEEKETLTKILEEKSAAARQVAINYGESERLAGLIRSIQEEIKTRAGHLSDTEARTKEAETKEKELQVSVIGLQKTLESLKLDIQNAELALKTAKTELTTTQEDISKITLDSKAKQDILEKETARLSEWEGKIKTYADEIDMQREKIKTFITTL